MPLESQVCSLEYAKKLMDLGVKKEVLFYYLNIDGQGKHYIYFNEHLPEEFEYEGDAISGFTSSELLEILPACIDIKRNDPFNYYWLNIQKRTTKNIKYIVGYFCDTYSAEEIVNFSHPLNTKKLFTEYDENFCDCLAKTLIYLIENKMIKVSLE